MKKFITFAVSFIAVFAVIYGVRNHFAKQAALEAAEAAAWDNYNTHCAQWVAEGYVLPENVVAETAKLRRIETSEARTVALEQEVLDVSARAARWRQNREESRQQQEAAAGMMMLMMATQRGR